MNKGESQLNKFYYSGDNIQFSRNIIFKNTEKIYIGSNIQIKQDCEFVVNDNCNTELMWNIKISDEAFFNSNVIIEAFNKIVIGKYVMFGPQVYVSDNNHEYCNYDVPIKLQGFSENENSVLIKDGAWIGAGSKIIGNVIIGFGSVIGANTVVVKDVPDHCLVAGIPGTIIKVCDYRTGKWISVKNKPRLLKEILLKRGKFNGYNYDWINEKIKNNHIDKKQESVEVVKYKELIDTIIEGLNYVNSQLKIDDFNKSIEIFNEMIIGIDSIIRALPNIVNKTQNINMKNQINEYLEVIVSAYEQKNIEKIIFNIDKKLIPSIKSIQNNCLE